MKNLILYAAALLVFGGVLLLALPALGPVGAAAVAAVALGGFGYVLATIDGLRISGE